MIINIIIKQSNIFTNIMNPQGMLSRTKEKYCKSRCKQESSDLQVFRVWFIIPVNTNHGLLHFYHYYQSQEGVSQE